MRARAEDEQAAQDPDSDGERVADPGASGACPGRDLAGRAANVRWAIDATHVFCGRDGWCHLS